MGVFFTAIFPLVINGQALCQQPQLETRFKAPYWQICWYGACFLFFCKIDKFFRILNGVYFATRWLIQIADTHAAVICQVSIALEHTISCIFLGCIDNFVCLSLSQ